MTRDDDLDFGKVFGLEAGEYFLITFSAPSITTELVSSVFCYGEEEAEDVLEALALGYNTFYLPHEKGGWVINRDLCLQGFFSIMKLDQEEVWRHILFDLLPEETITKLAESNKHEKHLSLYYKKNYSPEEAAEQIEEIFGKD